jgi:hypothetical protein
MNMPRYPFHIKAILGPEQSLRAMFHKLIGQPNELYVDIVSTRARQKLKHGTAKTASHGIFLDDDHPLCLTSQVQNQGRI